MAFFAAAAAARPKPRPRGCDVRMPKSHSFKVLTEKKDEGRRKRKKKADVYISQGLKENGGGKRKYYTTRKIRQKFSYR